MFIVRSYIIGSLGNFSKKKFLNETEAKEYYTALLAKLPSCYEITISHE